MLVPLSIGRRAKASKWWRRGRRGALPLRAVLLHGYPIVLPPFNARGTEARHKVPFFGNPRPGTSFSSHRKGCAAQDSLTFQTMLIRTLSAKRYA